MNVGPDHYRCARCEEVQPRTAEFYYFDKRGNVTGYCRPCHRAWFKTYWAAAFPYQKEHHRTAARAYNRRLHDVRPENYRVGREVDA